MIESPRLVGRPGTQRHHSQDPGAKIHAGTLIDTPDGLRAVETLAVGDRVSTPDGPKTVLSTGQTVLPRSDWSYRRDTWPVRVPVGSIGNTRPLRLAQGQVVRLWGRTVERMCDLPDLWVALGDLVGLRGLIIECPMGNLRYHRLDVDAGALDVDGAWCAVETGKSALPRDRVRAVFQEMHSASEPPVRALQS